MEEIVNPVNALIEDAGTTAKKAIAVAEEAADAAASWMTEAESLQDKIDGIGDECVEFDPSFIIDEVIETLRRDSRMPKLTLLEWEQLLGDCYAPKTIDVGEQIGETDDEEAGWWTKTSMTERVKTFTSADGKYSVSSATTSRSPTRSVITKRVYPSWWWSERRRLLSK